MKTIRLVTIGGGAIAGGVFGSGIGIALGPAGAIAGTVPCAIIGAYLGWRIYRAIKNRNKR